MEEATKFAWAYLLTHGNLTTGEWDYYTGWVRPNNHYISWDEKQEELATIRANAVSIGIDWTRTKPPEVKDEYQFTDTYNPSRDVLATVGTLYLLNGESFILASDDEEAAHLAKAAQELIKGVSPLQELADKL